MRWVPVGLLVGGRMIDPVALLNMPAFESASGVALAFVALLLVVSLGAGVAWFVIDQMRGR